MLLGRDESELAKLGALWTAQEIAQQPAMLRKTHAELRDKEDEIGTFVRSLLGRADMRIILTGAGSSGFVGECLAPYLSWRLGRSVEAVPTTDLVCAPNLYFQRTAPTLLVSFARSGSSPESVAAVELGGALVDEIHHLAITCNSEGALYCRLKSEPHSMTILLPEETNDRSFAMTSSVTCMMYAGLATFCPSETTANRLARIASGLESVISGEAAAMQALAARSHERVVYLGSHVFKGLAREAALKLTELTDGIGIAIPDSPMGFRHGPKTVVNSHTLIVIFVSNNAYSRRYDLDLIHELVRDGRSGGVMTICADDAGIPEAVQRVVVPDMASAPDVDLLFPFIAAPQIFACEASLARGLSPDRPNTAGTVHRVVQGVRIHPLH